MRSGDLRKADLNASHMLTVVALKAATFSQLSHTQGSDLSSSSRTLVANRAVALGTKPIAFKHATNGYCRVD